MEIHCPYCHKLIYKDGQLMSPGAEFVSITRVIDDLLVGVGGVCKRHITNTGHLVEHDLRLADVREFEIMDEVMNS